MTHDFPRQDMTERRLLVAFACLMLVLQGFLASLAQAHAFARMHDAPSAICHGGGANVPASQGQGSDAPTAPCTLCAFALAGAAITPAGAALVPAHHGERPESRTTIAHITTSNAPPRAGLSRAPPDPA